MPLQATSGAASQDAFGGGAAGPTIIPNYIEDVFSTYLYTGTGASQTITNNVDLSTNGGLVWIKGRSDATSHRLTDTARGVTKSLASNSASSQLTESTGLTAFGTTGFTIGADTDYNNSASTYVSWTLRKQTKFFDIVTWSGDSIYPRTITHNLGSVPGCIIVKNTTESNDWFTYHTSLGNFQAVRLNTTATPFVSSNNMWNVTSTTFRASAELGINESASTYVAYIFAHDAGGFGLSGSDNVISCGSFVSDASGGFNVSLGWEPQWVMQKVAIGASNQDWKITDTFRGMTASPSGTDILRANTSGASSPNQSIPQITATGFFNTSGGTTPSATHIYIAIRRGPMKVPTTGTSVYKSSLLAGNSGTQQITDLNFSPDLVMTKARDTSYGNRWTDRLRGFGYALRSDDVGAQLDNTTNGVNPFNMNGYTVLSGNPYNQSGFNYVNHAMRRAPSFFDEVCYTGTGSSAQIAHNLTVVPELIITKRRDSTGNWFVDRPLNTTSYNQGLLSSTGAFYDNWLPDGMPATSTTFRPSQIGSGQQFVAYLFATCAGVSKVGSYTGNGSSQTINCGFTGGARFVLIKATSTTGDWMVSDSARGIIAGSDPYLELNNTNPEVTGEDWLDTDSTGFVVNEVSGSNANTNGVSYIFLAIA